MEKTAREAAKVTPSTTSATPSTPLTTPGQEEPQPTAATEVNPEMPPLEDIRPGKKFGFKDPESTPWSEHFPN